MRGRGGVGRVRESEEGEEGLGCGVKWCSYECAQVERPSAAPMPELPAQPTAERQEFAPARPKTKQ